MSTLQLVRRDEYGSTSILQRNTDINKLTKEAKRLVTEDNIENALTYDEKLKNWQSGFVEFFDEEGVATTELIFGGPKVNKYIAISFDESGATEEIQLVHQKIIDPLDRKKKKEKPALVGIAYGVKIFIGHETPKRGQPPISLYAVADRGDVIDYVVPEVFQGKNIYYIQVLK